MRVLKLKYNMTLNISPENPLICGHKNVNHLPREIMRQSRTKNYLNEH